MFRLECGDAEFVEFALAGFAGEGEFLFEGVGFGLPLGLRFGTLMGGFRSEPGGFGVAGALGAVKFGEGASVFALPVGAVAVDLVEGGVVGIRLDIAAVLVVEVGEDGGGVAEALTGTDDFFALEGIGVVVPVGELLQTDGFGLVEAGERPAALGDVFDGEVFAAGEGIIDFAQFGEDLRVEGGVFVALDGVALDG